MNGRKEWCTKTTFVYLHAILLGWRMKEKCDQKKSHDLLTHEKKWTIFHKICMKKIQVREACSSTTVLLLPWRLYTHVGGSRFHRYNSLLSNWTKHSKTLSYICFSSPLGKWVPVRAEMVLLTDLAWCATYVHMYGSTGCKLPRELRWLK